MRAVTNPVKKFKFLKRGKESVKTCKDGRLRQTFPSLAVGNIADTTMKGFKLVTLYAAETEPEKSLHQHMTWVRGDTIRHTDYRRAASIA